MKSFSNTGASMYITFESPRTIWGYGETPKESVEDALSWMADLLTAYEFETVDKNLSTRKADENVCKWVDTFGGHNVPMYIQNGVMVISSNRISELLEAEKHDN